MSLPRRSDYARCQLSIVVRRGCGDFYLGLSQMMSFFGIACWHCQFGIVAGPLKWEGSKWLLHGGPLATSRCKKTLLLRYLYLSSLQQLVMHGAGVSLVAAYGKLGAASKTDLASPSCCIIIDDKPRVMSRFSRAAGLWQREDGQLGRRYPFCHLKRPRCAQEVAHSLPLLRELAVL